MKPGKKASKRLQVRINGYNKSMNSVMDKAAYTCPGSNKKS